MATAIKEIKEAVIGVNELALVLIMLFRDGIQVSDFADLWAKIQTDANFKAALYAAYENIKAAGTEIKDMDWTEGIDLATLQISYVPRIIEAFKKTPVG